MEAIASIRIMINFLIATVIPDDYPGIFAPSRPEKDSTRKVLKENFQGFIPSNRAHGNEMGVIYILKLDISGRHHCPDCTPAVLSERPAWEELRGSS